MNENMMGKVPKISFPQPRLLSPAEAVFHISKKVLLSLQS